MMKDIPSHDRRPSYIVRVAPNPVLEDLYRAVGLRTIVLDPRGEYAKEAWPRLLGDFLFQLASSSSSNATIPGRAPNKMFVSSVPLNEIERVLEGKGPRRRWSSLRSDPALGVRSLLDVVTARQVPPQLQQRAQPLYLALAALLVRSGQPGPVKSLLPIAIPPSVAASPEVTELVVRMLTRSRTREVVLSSPLPWKTVWEGRLEPPVATELLQLLNDESRFNIDVSNAPDGDIAYAAELAAKIASGHLIAEVDDEMQKRAATLIAEAANVYSAIAEVEPTFEEAPRVDAVLRQIEEERQRRKEEGLLDEEDIEFDLQEFDEF